MMVGNLITSRVEGIGNLSRAFKSLDIKLQQKIAPRMVATAGTVIKDAARNIAQAKGLRISGALINNIVIKRDIDVPASTVQYHVGVRHSRNIAQKIKILAISQKSGRVVTRSKRVKTLKVIRYLNDPFYAGFVERGHKIVSRSRTYRRGKNGKVRNSVSLKVRRNTTSGRVPPHPFLQPAFEYNQGRALAVMENVLQKFIAENHT